MEGGDDGAMRGWVGKAMWRSVILVGLTEPSDESGWSVECDPVASPVAMAAKIKHGYFEADGFLQISLR